VPEEELKGNVLHFMKMSFLWGRGRRSAKKEVKEVNGESLKQEEEGQRKLQGTLLTGRSLLPKKGSDLSGGNYGFAGGFVKKAPR